MAVHMQDRRFVARAPHADPLVEHQAVLGIMVSALLSLPAWAAIVWTLRAAF